ncbi:BSP-domain-containing protein [Macrolepiota fuliginosa MF-IS2]|uniref:BSP-domain-containing protein n=1 Tax=Macrolepiota fuliginosa MF-IS2 TaxID=1400762 RepID=A0A9P5XQD9_9AGAR|nr:BSP-domain-containing protein [Macrolepiota fuliginosa MF-IS2]
MPPTPPSTEWPIPKFLLRVDDLDHEGASLFFANVQPYDALREAVLWTFTILYTQETVPRKVKAIQLVLRNMPGVAHTFGTDTHKEIHFSLDWIKTNAHRARDEIMGVLTHEVVHCFQHDAQGTCPGGLIEGVADFVRFHAALSPPHWHHTAPSHTDRWDAGYEKTAYFLDWLNIRYGPSTTQTLNLAFRERRYHRRIFREITGRPLRKLWALYRASFSPNAQAGHAPDPPAESESEDEGYDRVSPIQAVLATPNRSFDYR